MELSAVAKGGKGKEKGKDKGKQETQKPDWWSKNSKGKGKTDKADKGSKATKALCNWCQKPNLVQRKRQSIAWRLMQAWRRHQRAPCRLCRRRTLNID
eukprot:6379806-Amphidinium_carterae.1